MPSHLFSPITIGPQTFANRIVVSPMCQYSANDGCAGAWHHKHLGTLAGSGAGLVMVEATAVERAGRITHGCLGLYSDANESAFSQTVAFCRSVGASKLGVQLSHSGRKGSCHVPWRGGGPLQQCEDSWRTYSPSASERSDAPACTQSDLDRIKQAFVDATLKAVRIGFDVIELHAGHGYLLHQFLSPLANRRSDVYGGSLAHRMRFPLEVFDAIRAAAPLRIVVGARITGSDWIEGGITIEEAQTFARELEAHGCAYVDVTSGGVAAAKIPVGPGYQVPLAAAIKKTVNMSVRAVGMIVTARQAEEVIASGAADAVALGRAFIDNPHWPYEAARVLGREVEYPPQYARAAPKAWPGFALKNAG